MKHINKTILFMALAAAAFTACDDDEDPAFAPEVTISRAEGSTSCVPGTTYELTAQTTESVDTLCWLLDGGKVSDAASYTFTAADLGVHEIILRAGNALGEDADTLYFNVHKAEAGRISSVNDITNWTGDGANRSVLAVQWVTGTEILNPADSEVFFRAWGYRWADGEEQTGLDMLKAVAANDPRLFVIITESDWGSSASGFVYDGNGDGAFTLSNSTLTLTQADFTDGVYAGSTTESYDGMTVSDGDYWIGGFMEAFTCYWNADMTAQLPESFSESMLMMNTRILTDNSWDAWTLSVYDPENPVNPQPKLYLLEAAE